MVLNYRYGRKYNITIKIAEKPTRFIILDNNKKGSGSNYLSP